MNKLCLAVFFTFFLYKGYTQVSNNNFNTGTININLPKTPESQGFENYGKIPVSELTGSPNIAIPLYTVRSKFLEAPVTLSYTPGVRVNQESSWVGLGFDLIAGGRITVETRGSVDNDSSSSLLFSSSGLKYGMQKLFTRLGNSNDVSIYTYASTCQGCDTTQVPYTIPDDWASVNAMAQFGLGEPDIFRANFLGHSLTFFFDKITDSLRFIGEKSLFDITLTKDGFGRIINWAIKDNSGNAYYFDQKEYTTHTLPAMGPLYNNMSATAWLLNKVVHPAGDSIVFTYTNYGNSYPIADLSASMVFMEDDRQLTNSNDNEQNSTILEPAYLTKIESDDMAVEFILGSRDDLRGAGSKRLNEIQIKDKQTNTVKRKVKFAYSYFDGSLGTCYSSLPDSVKKFYRLRLKLDAVTPNDSSTLLQTPYQFFYINNGIPAKISIGQDHWGYYNALGGTYVDPCSPKNLIPITNIGTLLGYPELNAYGVSRDCDPYRAVTMSMDSIIYPTGGSSKFIYEPHESTTMLGGGLRIKAINNYTKGRRANSIEYTYQAGTFMGSVNYNKYFYMLAPCEMPFLPGNSQNKFVLSSSGFANDNDLVVAYSHVTITEKDEKGQANGSVIKIFNVPNPRYTMGGLGFEYAAAHWPTTSDAGPGLTSELWPQTSGYPPTPTMQLDGKLVREEYYDKAGALLRSLQYYYTQADYSEKFYRVQAMDLRLGGPDASTGGCSGFGAEFDATGARRYTVFVSPAKSFYTLTDSVVEKLYQGINPLTTKKVYKYNSHYQPEFETVYNSDGTQTITRTVTSLALTPKYPLAPSGDAVAMNDLKANHIYDLPIEQTLMTRNTNGDSLVLQNRVNYYQGPLPKKVFILETDKPLAYKTQFIPLYYDYPNYPNAPGGSSYTVKMDTKHRLYSTADYSPKGQIAGLQGLQGNSAYIWDEYYNNLLAQAVNADSVDIAFTSFETPAKGRWNFNPALAINESLAPTGSKAYGMASGSISRSGLSTSKAYIVSYWRKSGTQTVNSTSGTAGPVINGWTYYEHTVTNPASGTITVSGSGTIDELRLYPKTAQMISYAYLPLIGMSSQCDVNNRISYFEYDAIGRLSRVRDEKRNILRQVEYKYQDVFNYTYGNTAQSQTFTRNNCGAGYNGSTLVYTVPADKYGSFISVADANRKAQAEITAFNGQTVVNQTGTCVAAYSYSPCCQWQSPYNNFNLTGTGYVNFSVVIYNNYGIPSGQFGTLSGALFLPSATRTLNITTGGKTYTLTIYSSGQMSISGTNVTGTVQLNGTYAL